MTSANSKQDEAASYDEDAEVFDRLAERYSGAYAEFACEFVGVGPGDSVLDAGTGTGLLARALGARIGGSGKVLGIDLSHGMLEVAEQRGRRLGLVPHVVRFQPGDIEALDLPDRSVDLVSSLFVIRHLPDPAAALKELRRVLRPGGRIVLSMGCGAPLLSARAIPYRLGRLGAKLRGRMGLRLEAPAYMLGLLDRYLDPSAALHGTEGHNHLGPRDYRALERMLAGAGFVDIRHAWRGQIDRLHDAQEFWDVQVHHCSPARYRIRASEPERVAALRTEFLRGANEVLDRGGQLAYSHGACFIRATLPS